MLKASQNINNLLPVIAVLFLIVSLSACQTTLPVFEENQESSSSVTEDRDCTEKKKTSRNVQYDYLVYANKMIDSMVKNRNVQAKLKQQRMKIYLQPVVNNTSDNIDISAINYAIKNRVIRSGQFILADSPDTAQYRISGKINSINTVNDCDSGQRKFSLSLTGTKQAAILWSEYKNLK